MRGLSATSRAGILFVVLAAALHIAAPALAQNAAPAAARKDPDSIPVFYADFGWTGKLVTERWGPITVWVVGGETAYSGTMVAEFRQDSTQSARIAIPFATTPGKLTPVRFVAALPAYCTEVNFTLHDERGRPARSITYAVNAGGGTDAAMPPLLSPGTGLLVGIGRTSLVEGAQGWSLDKSLQDALDRLADMQRRTVEPPPGAPPRPHDEEELRIAWNNIKASRIEPDAMPLAGAAYDGVLAVVVEADAALRADVRAMAALHGWVRAGGRLVIVASGPGGAWRDWIPDHPAGPPVELGPVVDAPLPPEVSEALLAAAAADARRNRRREPSDEPGVAERNQGERPPIAAPADRAPQRAVRLTPSGEAEGWSLRWLGPEGAVLAEGPVEFGWVTVIGLDPQRAGAVLSERATGITWQSALQEATRDWIAASIDDERRFGTLGWSWRRGGSLPTVIDTPASRALDAAAQTLSEVSPPSDLVFLGIAGAVALLAVLVGPFDAIALKRLRMAQRSWLTALVWIGAASAGAYIAPEVLRSGSTQVTRYTVLDRLVHPDDPPVARAYQSGVTGLFVAESGRLEFARIDPTSWWRGFAVESYLGGDGRLPAPVPTTQAPDGRERGNPLESFGVGMWTFRTFTDQSAPPTSVTGRLRRDHAGEGWKLSLAGLPDTTLLVGGLVRIGNRWHVLRESGVPIFSTLEADLRDNEAAARPPAFWEQQDQQPTFDDWGNLVYYAPPHLGYKTACELPGADRRSLSIERRLATGRWTAVYLHVAALPSDIGIGWDAEYGHQRLIRLILPIDDSDSAGVPARPAHRENGP